MSFLNEFFVNVGTIGLAISLLWSLASCFLGYKLMKVWITVAGFVLGFLLGDAVCALLHVESFGVFFFIGAVVGIALAIVSFKLYKVGVFLLGTVLGWGIALSVLGNEWTYLHIFIAILMSLAVGVLAVVAVKPAVIFSSAISGGLSALRTAWTLFAFGSFTDSAATIVLWGGLAVALAGVVVQFITNKKKPESSAQT